MKTTIDLPDDLIREAKLRAVIRRQPLKDLIADFIRQGLGMTTSPVANESRPSQRVKVAADGLPVIVCSARAPASHASLDELLELEQQADAEDAAQRVGSAV